MIISLPELPVCFVGLHEHEDRWSRIDAWTKEHGYSDVTQFKNEKNKSLSKYGDVRLRFIEALESIKSFPSILFEDDATPTKWYANDLEVPDNAGVIYLGGSWFGLEDKGGARIHHVERTIIPYEPDPRFGRVVNMMATHAMLFMTEEARDDVLCIIEDDPYDQLCHDFHLCLSQKDFDMLVLRKPLFYQQDGANDKQTNAEL